MPARAKDIELLEQMLNSAASDQALTQQAILICDRLRHQVRAVRHGSRAFSGPDLEHELRDFEMVIIEIWNRRSGTVLNDYITHVQTYGGPLDG